MTQPYSRRSQRLTQRTPPMHDLDIAFTVSKQATHVRFTTAWDTVRCYTCPARQPALPLGHTTASYHI